MFTKFATATVISAEIATRDAYGLVKAGHRAVFNYTPREGYLYVRSRMISSRCNDNFDEFPPEEILHSWKTAVGKPAFVNHHNENHKRMRGVIIDAAIHEDTLPDGKPDIWVEALHELDAKAFPRLAKAIIEGKVNRTSMGCDVGFSVCSACGNKATSPAEYCQHIPKMKGKILYKHTASGQREGHLIREICHKISFFENSFLVEDPADPTAVVTGIDQRGLNKAAARREPGPGQGELFDLPPGAQQASAPRPQKPSDGFDLKGGPLSWDEIGQRHPSLYGDPEYHGEAADGADGEGIGWAAAHLAFNRAEDPDDDESDVHALAFHPELVHPKHIDYARHGGGDSRVSHAREGYEDDPKQVPPLVLVHRHGVYQVADGHHRAEGASAAGKKVRAYVAYSPHADEPYSDGGMAPFHQADPHAGRQPRTAALHQGEPFRIVPKDGKVLVVDAQGKTRGEHNNEQDAKVHQATLYASLPEAGDVSGIQNPERSKDTATEIVRGRMANRKTAETHPDAACPSCGSKNFIASDSPQADDPDTGKYYRSLGPLGACQDCGESFNATKSLQENLDERNFAKVRGEEFTRGRAGQEELFRNITPNQTEDALGGHYDSDAPNRAMHERQRVERLRGGMLGLTPTTPEAINQRQQQVIERSQPYTEPYGPMNKSHLSRLRTLAELSDDDIFKGLDMPTADQGRKDIVHEKAKGLADSLMAPFYEPHGGQEGYHTHLDNQSMIHLQDRYRGGTGKFAFDEAEPGERAEPYYEIKHTTPQGRHTGWSIRHYADGPMAEIHHDATPGEAHDAIDIGRPIGSDHNPFGRHQPPDNYGHNELAADLHHWVNDDESGSVEHLEGKYGDPRIRRHKQRYPQGKLPPRNSKVAYGETKAPADVDTLRTESCPVCGETDSFDGDRCDVCNFLQPPSMFMDPDTSVAKQMDLEKVPFDQGMVGPNGMPMGGVDEQAAAMEGVPGTPDDGIADLFCPACGFSADTQAPQTNNDPAMPSVMDPAAEAIPNEEPQEEQAQENPAADPAQEENPEAPSGPPEGAQGLVEGDVCPNCGQATMLSPNDIGEMGGEVPQEIADDGDADGIPDAKEQDEDKDGIPDDAEDADQDGIPDDAEPDLDGDGIPDDSEEPDAQEAAPEGSPDEAEEEVAESGPVEDEEDPQKSRKDNSRRAYRRGIERETMTKQQPKQAASGAPSEIAALHRIIAKQDRQIAMQRVALETGERKLHYLANLAGVSKEFNAITAQGQKKIADILNPAQPIPDPPSGAPVETTEQALAPEAMDDPRNPGITPGSLNGVPAQATDSPLNPGTTLPTSPYGQMVDVTQPVAGTEEHVPLDQTKIETDVRVGDPMVGAGTPLGTAFPLNPEFAADGSSYANQVNGLGMPTNTAAQRTMASLRLARLRKNAGLSRGTEDEFVVAAGIEKDASLSTAMIEHEVITLEAIAKQRAPRGNGGRPVRQATAERRTPSLASLSVEASAPTGEGFAASDASDLFLDI